MDNFFYNLNKKMSDLAQRQDLAESAVTERDMGKHNNATTGFKALAKKAGGGEKGNRIAGAQFQKMKKAGQLEETDMDESALQAYIGDKKYGRDGMEALRKAGRDGASKDKTQTEVLELDAFRGSKAGDNLERFNCDSPIDSRLHRF